MCCAALCFCCACVCPPLCRQQVFNWVPTLMHSYSEGIEAFFGIQGIVFSLLMLSISIGGSLFSYFESAFAVESFSVIVLNDNITTTARI